MPSLRPKVTLATTPYLNFSGTSSYVPVDVVGL
jgi:hypothetical protein